MYVWICTKLQKVLYFRIIQFHAGFIEQAVNYSISQRKQMG